MIINNAKALAERGRKFWRLFANDNKSANGAKMKHRSFNMLCYGIMVIDGTTGESFLKIGVYCFDEIYDKRQIFLTTMNIDKFGNVLVQVVMTTASHFGMVQISLSPSMNSALFNISVDILWRSFWTELNGFSEIPNSIRSILQRIAWFSLHSKFLEWISFRNCKSSSPVLRNPITSCA